MAARVMQGVVTEGRMGEVIGESETSGFLDRQIAEALPLLDEAPSSRTFEVAARL